MGVAGWGLTGHLQQLSATATALSLWERHCWHSHCTALRSDLVRLSSSARPPHVYRCRQVHRGKAHCSRTHSLINPHLMASHISLDDGNICISVQMRTSLFVAPWQVALHGASLGHQLGSAKAHTARMMPACDCSVDNTCHVTARCASVAWGGSLLATPGVG
jgi:hypothetical protein